MLVKINKTFPESKILWPIIICFHADLFASFEDPQQDSKMEGDLPLSEHDPEMFELIAAERLRQVFFTARLAKQMHDFRPLLSPVQMPVAA